MTDVKFLNSFRYLLKKLPLFALSLMTLESYAAPHPGMGSSSLVSIEKGFFWNREGFTMNVRKEDWILDEVLANENQVSLVEKPNRANQNTPTGSLLVKVENLKTELTLENYAKKWMKDYANYGFELLGSQPLELNKSKGLLVDFHHKKSFQQIRQVLFLRGRKMVLITCADDKKRFTNLLARCNQVIQTFNWLPEKKGPIIR